MTYYLEKKCFICGKNCKTPNFKYTTKDGMTEIIGGYIHKKCRIKK